MRKYNNFVPSRRYRLACFCSDLVVAKLASNSSVLVGGQHGGRLVRRPSATSRFRNAVKIYFLGV